MSGRITVTKEVEAPRYVDVEVDVTDEVHKLAAEEADKRHKQLLAEHAHSLSGMALVDLNIAIVGVIRLHNRSRARGKGAVTHAAINRLLLDLIGSDALRREVGAAMGEGR